VSSATLTGTLVVVYGSRLTYILRFSFSDLLINAYFALVEKLVSTRPRYRGARYLFRSIV